MEEEIRELKSERKIEKRELRQNNNKKKGLIAGAVVTSVAALGLGLGLGLGLRDKKYEIKVDSTLSTADPIGDGKYEIGDEVTIEAEEIPGYRFDHWEFNGNEITSNPYIFELTEDKIGEYTAVYEEEYTITLSNFENGNVSVVDNKTNAIYDEEVKLSVTPNTNYALNKLYYVEEDSETQVTISNLTFTMPANNITIYAEFIEIEYTATVSDTIQNGSITLSPNGGIVGTEVTVTVTPNEGYELTRLYYTTTSGETEITDNTFVMPGENVVVCAEFSLKQYTLGTIPSQVTVKRGEETLTSNSTITHGDTLTITYDETEGYTKTNFSVTGATLVTQNTYTVTGNVNIEYTEQINTYTVTFYDYDKQTVLDTVTVDYGKTASTSVTPTKASDNTYTYAFDKWVDANGDAVSLTNITANTNVYASYKETYIEYTIGEIPSQVTIKKGETTLTSSDTLHYGDEIAITYIPTEGYTGQIDITGANLVSENTYTVIGNISLTYSEVDLSNYSLLTLNVDGEEISQYIAKNSVLYSSIPQIDTTGTYLNNEYTCGFYTDKNLTQELSETAIITEAITLYTKKATLDKLAFTFDSITSTFSVKGNDKTATEIVIPKAYKYTEDSQIYPVTTISISAFKTYSSLTSVTIPEGVTSIVSNAFSNCSNLTSIIIPISVTSIGDYAFSFCSSLTSLALSASITSIEKYTFQSCTGLTNVEIPISVTSIGDYAFSNCRNLTSIIIPISVTSIGNYAFQNCYALAEIYNYSDLTITKETTDNGCLGNYAKVVYNKSDLKGEKPASRIKMIDNVQYYVHQSDFIALTPSIPRANLTSVTLDTRTTEINQYAFISCKSLISIEISSSVTSIGDHAFFSCTSLISVKFGENAQLTSIGDSAFYSCESLKSITIPANVTYIGSSVFYNTLFLTNLQTTSKGIYTCSNGTKYMIKASANITNIDLTGVKIIASNAFQSCTKLTNITIPSSVTSIGNNAFFSCRGLTSITIPSSVTSIGNNVFMYCNSLTEINVSSENEKYISENGVLYNKDKTTLICYPAGKTDTTFIISSSVTNIENYAFDSCTSITEVTISSGVTSIGDGAFRGCTSLTNIEIPSSVTIIGSYAFSGCTSLTSVIFEDSEGWYVANSSTATSGTNLSSTDLLNTSTAATYLTSTYGYQHWFNT